MRAPRTGRALAVLAAVCAVGLAAAVPAAATAADEGGLWYYNVFELEDVHASGITGEGVTIAMIDTPVNLDIPTLQGADVRVQESFCLDASGVPYPGTTTDEAVGTHGTNVLSLLVGSGEGLPGQTGVKGVAPGATVLTYAVVGNDCQDLDTEQGEVSAEDAAAAHDPIGASILDAVHEGADIISVSKVAGNSELMTRAIATALRNDVIVVAGLSNGLLVNDDGKLLGESPANLNGVISVLGMQPNGELNLIDVSADSDLFNLPNTSELVDVVAPGWAMLAQGSPQGTGDWSEQHLRAGTSLATPFVSANLALAAQKYPEATGNQLIQSLIHNTGLDPHPLEWDAEYGYGVVVTTTLLAADPAEYPDVNPLIDEDPEIWGPTPDEIWEAEATTTPEPTDIPATAAPEPGGDEPGGDDADASTTPGWLWPVIIVGAVLLIVAAAVIGITTARKRAATITDP